MPTFKAFVVAALLSGLVITMNFTAEIPTSDTLMMVNTPVATL